MRRRQSKKNHRTRISRATNHPLFSAPRALPSRRKSQSSRRGAGFALAAPTRADVAIKPRRKRCAVVSGLVTVEHPPIHAARSRQHPQARRFAGWKAKSRLQTRLSLRDQAKALASAPRNQTRHKPRQSRPFGCCGAVALLAGGKPRTARFPHRSHTGRGRFASGRSPSRRWPRPACDHPLSGAGKPSAGLRREPLIFDARFFRPSPGLAFKLDEGLQLVGGEPPLSQQINRLQGPFSHQGMDSLLAHPEQGGRTAKRKQTAFPAGYGTKIAKDMQNDFFHFPLRQINGYGGGCFVGWRYHVQRLVYSFMKVHGYCACPAAETGSRTTGPKSTRAAYLCDCCLDRCGSKAHAKTPPFRVP